MTDAIVVIDLGTSSIKALLVDRDGLVLARERAPHATLRPTEDAAEQDPNEWWNNVKQLIAGMTDDGQRRVSVRAIAVTGQMHGLVLRDSNGATVGNAITWQDRRSAAALPALLDHLPITHPAHRYQRIEPGFQVASWYWLCEHQPERPEQASHLSSPKDDLIHHLTGNHVTDPSDAIGTGLFASTTGAWDPSVAAAANLPLEYLPTIIPAGGIAGTIRPDVATSLDLGADTPVVIAGGDAAVASLGAGAVQPSQSLLMLSSGCQILQPCQDRSSLSASKPLIWPSANPPGLPQWLQVRATLNGGNVIDWAHRTFP